MVVNLDKLGELSLKNNEEFWDLNKIININPIENSKPAKPKIKKERDNIEESSIIDTTKIEKE